MFFSFAVCSLAYAADTSTISDEAIKQLVSQSEDFRKETKRLTLEEEKKPEIVVEEEREAPVEEKGPIFFVKKIILEGNTVYPTEEFARYMVNYENRETTFSELKELAQAITNHYRSHGYTTSRAYIPPQKLEGNTAVIKIIEGKIGKVIVEGNKYFKSSLYTRGIRIPKDRLFRYQDLETNLYFLNQKPDRRAKAYLVSGEDPNTSDIVLKAEETLPVHAYYVFHNRGTKLTHRARHEAHLDYTNFTGNGDIMNSNFSMAEEGAFDGGFIQYTFPIEATGTTLELGASYVESMLIGHLKPFEIKGESLTVTPGITQSFIEKPNLQIDGFVGFEIKDSKTLIDDNKSSFDRMRVLRTGPRFTFQDTGGRTLLSGDVHWGIPDFLGSLDEVDPRASRENAGGDFIYYTASVARLQRLPHTSYVVVRGSGQWTKDNLTSVEQYRLGGAFSVRGYPESDASGDYGYNLSSELNIPAFFIPKSWQIPFRKEKWHDTIRLVGFLDGGKTYIRERSADGVVKDKFLLGTGFGLRFDLNNNIAFVIDLGWPLGDTSTDEDQMQVHLSFRAGF